MITVPNHYLNSTFVAMVSIISTLEKRLQTKYKVDPWILSDEVIQYVYTINLAIVCAALCLTGIVTNIINIVVIAKMKFRETMNIALMGLTISDLCSVTSLLWLTICYNPLFMYSDLPILTLELQHKTGGWTHVIFTRVTAFITVYITLERCLCIAFPLTIKTMLTPNRVVGVMAGIYVTIFGSMIPNYTNFKLLWKFVPQLNKTMFGMVYTRNRFAIQTAQYYLNVFYIMISFTSVIVCSCILIWKLRQNGKFVSIATSGQSERAIKHNRIIKMVICVAIVFIVSFTPSVIFFLALVSAEEFNYGGKYQGLFLTVSTICLSFDAMNSTINIFIYYKMSSRYAAAFRSLFDCRLNRLLDAKSS